jgi:sporadic carbohydrate cluster 2OG-Fe(II) oxygenase
MNFKSTKDGHIEKLFLKNGYYKQKIHNKKKLIELRNKILKIANQSNFVKEPLKDLNNIHKFISKSQINSFRLEVINNLNLSKQIKKAYYMISKDLLYNIVGNELMMQKNLNLSIQMPNDETSLLPIHSDVWSGDSPYEANIWLPLVDCYKTKSMYILNQKYYNFFINIIKKNKITNSEEIYNMLKKKLTWINIKFGEFLIFNQSLPHGNIVNKENTTRWSFNCRFKSIGSTYADKKVGEFFLPIKLKPMTQIGLNYKDPFSNE